MRALCSLGLLYIATFLRSAGYATKIIDLNLVYAEVDKLQTIIELMPPKILGISTLTETFPAALKIAQLAKQINPSLYVVMGGAHPSVMPNEVLSHEEVDAVIIGEGEYTMRDLADCLIAGKGKLSDIAGLVYKEGAVIRANPERDFLNDPDLLPVPDRQLLPIHEYECPATVLASRGGCPYGCRYCAVNNIWKGKRRYRRPEKVVEETAN